MADILIRGMRIPPQCVLYDEYRVPYYKCPFADEGKWGVLVCTCPNRKRGARIVNDYTETRHPDCPLVPLPEGHGRLIDADALKKYWQECEEKLGPEKTLDLLTYHDVLSEGVIYDLDKAPTIAPAEGGTDNG